MTGVERFGRILTAAPYPLRVGRLKQPKEKKR